MEIYAISYRCLYWTPVFVSRKISANLAVIIEVLGAIRFSRLGALEETSGLERILMPEKAAKFAFDNLLKCSVITSIGSMNGPLDSPGVYSAARAPVFPVNRSMNSTSFFKRIITSVSRLTCLLFVKTASERRNGSSGVIFSSSFSYPGAAIFGSFFYSKTGIFISVLPMERSPELRRFGLY